MELCLYRVAMLRTLFLVGRMAVEHVQKGVKTTASIQSEGVASAEALDRLVRLQRWIDWALLIPFYAVFVAGMRVFGRYRIADLRTLRQAYRKIATSHPHLVICANHVTFIDSAIIIWAFGSPWWYLRNFNKFSWNLPAGDFFKKRWIYRLVAFLSKCIFIHRDGSKEHKTTILQQCRDLIADGDVVTIFPEGKRSRSGRFDPALLTYGVGRIVQDLDGRCAVLCVYVRSHLQDRYSDYPPRGSIFNISMELIQPTAQGPGAHIAIVQQIGRTLQAMEQAYFSGDKCRFQGKDP